MADKWEGYILWGHEFDMPIEHEKISSSEDLAYLLIAAHACCTEEYISDYGNACRILLVSKFTVGGKVTLRYYGSMTGAHAWLDWVRATYV